MTDDAQGLTLALAQLNPAVGDVSGNLDRARAARARSPAADIVVLTELFICGYPPEDLMQRPAFVAACRRAVEELAAETKNGPAVIVGAPWVEADRLYNSVLLLAGGAIAAVRHKVELPNYGVFDEKRVFHPGPRPDPVRFRDIALGLPICEDLWSESVCADLGAAGADVLLSIHGSPYWRGKLEKRRSVARAAAAAARRSVVYLNMTGGQDELAFDGGSFGMNADGEIVFQYKQFADALESISLVRGANGAVELGGGGMAATPGPEEADWLACVTGLRDYVVKNGFAKVVLGLSGGIDSAVVATMAVDALGAENVRCVMMPSRYTSEISLEDAMACAARLGARYDIVRVEDAIAGLGKALEALFAGRNPDVTEENLQARARGTLLMAISNKFGELLLSTGNKSEVSVGYATLYGDMNGAFNPVKDLFKTEVYRLARWRNSHKPEVALGPAGDVIPQRILTRAPSAELREDQTDQDSLPPYETLDVILTDLIEREQSVASIIAKGYDGATVERIARLVLLAEYKRRQAAPGVKITSRNLGRDRRYPITNRFVERA